MPEEARKLMPAIVDSPPLTSIGSSRLLAGAYAD
jgi:hypothetical protein